MPPPEPDRDELLNWVEHVAAFFDERFGLPPITGRILGWLMVCDPPEQSAGEIAKAIGASRASLTTNMRMLTVSSLVRRRSRPGGRTTYFRIDDDAWEKVIRQRIASMAAFCEIATQGMRLLGPGSARATRVRNAHDMFEWMGRTLAAAQGPGLSKPPARVSRGRRSG
jgi:hypothetical protein